MHPAKPAQPYWNPYVAGVGLGLVLLASFVVMGRGLGASGAFASTITAGLNTVAPGHVAANPALAEYLKEGTNPLMDWLVFEVLGVFVGGYLSGMLAHRVTRTVEKGPRITTSRRLVFAFIGGVLMGVGAKFARGCTSGQALTGGALLNAGSWAFMIMVFAGAYALAYFMRRQWT
ncbi:MAG: YeeE/YedE thiosulfate transporter family protein [Gemmatimonadaceae bacterium]